MFHGRIPPWRAPLPWALASALAAALAAALVEFLAEALAAFLDWRVPWQGVHRLAGAGNSNNPFS